ncbi:dimethylarginine dimethylaminohydrolase family protein [Alkalihalobacillus pseudalcaliphilus]|uniref:dimethylarginine dimethylaminohydrolase family protein n=1 Tax=Alkalihalobacillus pseudalcaliphilus TaxID=79884 RepID=UPI00064DC184|nr:arginine deiminase family protein [Alkalihalobacillus pseudalcaliphilus]KMK74743.1 hypothetical protein AB990_19860 [Alkalihalobacillus pseudalcaliphilus]
MIQIQCLTEYEQLQKVVLCQPTYMSIEEAINEIQAHYKKANINRGIAQSEHQMLVETLRKHGVDVMLISANEECPEQVFTRDIGFVIEDTLYVGHLKRDIRKKEREQLLQFLQQEKIPYHEIEAGTIEGGDVVLAQSDVFIGNSGRTAKVTLELLQMRHPNHSFHLIDFDEKYLHLDCVFNPISESEALIYPPAINEESLKIIQRKYDCIEVDDEEQFSLAVNILSLGHRKIVALPKNEQTNRKLIERGFEVIEIDFSEIIKSGGSFRCVTLPLRRNN